VLKISASYSKKVPGTEPYSSEGVHVSIEAEVPQSLLAEPQELQGHIQEMFREVRASVEQQLEGERRPGPVLAASRQPAFPRPAGNGAQPRASTASPRQIQYAASLAKRVWNLSPEELARELGVSRLDELTGKQASDLIERLKAPGRAS
jgi:hypothetical protein